MDPTRFDVLARRLATGASRRQVLKGLAAGLLGTTIPLTTSAAPRGNSLCAHFCATVFGADTPAADQCTSEAARGAGLCYSCGPASSGGTKQLCCSTSDAGFCTSYGGVTCPNFEADVSNCGACDRVCPDPSSGTGSAACSDGTCGIICSGNTPDVCGTACVDKLTDVSNCGVCGMVCPGPTSGTGTATCSSGGCGIICSGSIPKLCGTSCIPASVCCTNADCDATHACLNGACLARGGQLCQYGTDCFTQNCVNHVCAGVCAGNHCEYDYDCTTGMCSNGVCQQTYAGGACHCGTDCSVTGNCVRDSNVYWGTCAPVRGGSDCVTDAGCTSGNCQGGICQPNGAGGTCYYQEDCIPADYCRNASRGVNGTCYPR